VTEAAFQGQLIRKLKNLFPGCVVLKNDPQYQQGILDLTVLWGPFWGMLEVKAARDSRRRPNQDYFVELLDDMSFAAYIYPDNEEEVLSALQEAFASRGAACLPQS
jgi:hypothetical protein